MFNKFADLLEANLIIVECTQSVTNSIDHFKNNFNGYSKLYKYMVAMFEIHYMLITTLSINTI